MKKTTKLGLFSAMALVPALAGAQDAADHPTYAKEVSRIIQDNCQICHHHHEEEQIKQNQFKGCYVCHTSSFDFEYLNRPRLVGAYHQSCLGCHKDRGVGPITCDECHVPEDTEISGMADQ